MLFTDRSEHLSNHIILRTFFSTLWLLICLTSSGQIDSTEKLTVRKILIEGNRKTKERIIVRELSMMEGSNYTRYQLDSIFTWDKNRIYNTNLFNEVELSLSEVENDSVDVRIDLDERWYLYPLPIFNLVDRNFNDWWVNRNRDFSRVNYGLRLTQFNFRGRSELLRLWLQTGFQTVVNVIYQVPYMDKKQRHGLLLSSSYFEAKNVPVVTRENVRRFASSQDEVLRRAYRNGLTHTFRSSFYSFHNTSIGHLRVDIADTVANINTNYLGDSRTQQQHFWVGYNYTWDRRNNRNYPTNGEWYRASLFKHGLGVYDDGVDFWRARVALSKYLEFKDNWFLATNLVAFSTFPLEDRAYFNYYSMGFLTEVIRGYELRIIEAGSYFMQRNEFKHQLIGRKYNIKKVMPIRQFQTLPVTIYGKVFFDQGYAASYPNYDGSDLLTDQYLYSVGAGLDLVLVNDLTFRLELSRNGEGQTNFFINLLSLL